MKQVTQKDVDALIRVAKRHLPSFDICRKQDSWIQRAIGKLLMPVNSGYMTEYATTMFGKVWLPHGADEWAPVGMYILLRHELIHLLDAKKYNIGYVLSYLFLLPAVLTMRSFWEMRGYTQTLTAIYEIYGEITQDDLDWVSREFTSSQYVWMNPFRSQVQQKLKRRCEQIRNGEIFGMFPYLEIDIPPLGGDDDGR